MKESQSAIKTAKDITLAYPDEEPERIVDILTTQMDKWELRSFARWCMAKQIKSIQRDVCLSTEIESTLGTRTAFKGRSYVDTRGNRTVVEDGGIVYVNGYRMDPEFESLKSLDKVAAHKDLILGNRPEREAFREWIGEKDFESWYARAHQVAETLQGQYASKMAEAGHEPTERSLSLHGPIATFEDSWDSRGPMAAAEHRLSIQMRKDIQALINSTAERVELEVTAKLLKTKIALGDGAVVTWGTATVPDHERRISLLEGNIQGNLEAATRHAVAIRKIKESGVSCLAEIPGLNAQ